ncbi:AzlC family ABC transporter permease [Streptomyces sp. NPDC002888]|uniref:AzlC family ABC transporter permease n=1 Tax=Streptomyces sp. NPDC002888 TaxID=3364668 RepID=UPI0036797A3E
MHTPSPAVSVDSPKHAPPPASKSSSEAAAALKDSGAVGLGMFPLGVAFGVLVVHSGLSWWWAPVISGLVYAGSLEFLLVGMIVAVAPLAQIALSAFLINFRHVFYALSFPLHRVESPAGKAYAVFGMTDEAYALTSGGAARSWSGRRILWLQAFLQTYWVSGATAGALLGAVIPPQVVGLDFALTALFAVLTVDAVRARRELPTPVLALICALVARFAFPSQMLLVAFALFTTALLARYTLTKKAARA